MFGSYRLFLASLVVFAHLGGAGLGFGAGYAVYNFYLLSGWLMALIINEKYYNGLWGFGLFCLNRSLRIFPLYWLGCVLTLLLLLWFGSSAFHESIRIPSTAGEIFSNIFMIGLVVDDKARLIPPAWAVANELVFYFFIGAILGRKLIIAILWVGLSLSYHVIAVFGLVMDTGWELDRYYSLLSSSLPFSLGVLLYHLRGKLNALFPFSYKGLSITTFAYLAFIVVAAQFGQGMQTVPFFMSI